MKTPTFNDCRVFGYFRRIERAISFAAFPWRSYNRICDILEHISGVGCRIDKQSKENPNWVISVDPSQAVLEWPSLFSFKTEGGKIYIWLPSRGGKGPADCIFVNGLSGKVIYNGGSDSSSGWYEYGSIPKNGETYCLIADGEITTNHANKEADVLVTCNIGPSSPNGGGSSDYYEEIPLAHVTKDGEVYQFHTGAVFLSIGASEDVKKYDSISYDATRKQLIAMPTLLQFRNGAYLNEWKPTSQGERDDAEEVLLMFGDCACDVPSDSSSSAS